MDNKAFTEPLYKEFLVICAMCGNHDTEIIVEGACEYGAKSEIIFRCPEAQRTLQGKTPAIERKSHDGRTDKRPGRNVIGPEGARRSGGLKVGRSILVRGFPR